VQILRIITRVIEKSTHGQLFPLICAPHHNSFCFKNVTRLKVFQKQKFFARRLQLCLKWKIMVSLLDGFRQFPTIEIEISCFRTIAMIVLDIR